MFIVLAFCRASYSIVFHNKSSELLVGCMIGVAFMLAQLFFVLMVVFFIFGGEADINNPGKFELLHVRNRRCAAKHCAARRQAATLCELITATTMLTPFVVLAIHHHLRCRAV